MVFFVLLWKLVYDLFVMYLLKKVEFFELVSFMFVLVFVDFVEDYIVLLIIYVVEVIVYGVYEIF